MEYFEIGKIVNTHGIHGEVRVLTTTDFVAQRFAIDTTVYVRTLRQPQPQSLTVKTVRRHKQFLLVSFEELADLTAVEPLKGGKLLVGADQRHDLADGEFYYSDIIGLTVVDESNEPLGTVKEILSPGANDVWVVARKHQSDLLLPAIKSVILHLDLSAHTVTVAVPEGLDD